MSDPIHDLLDQLADLVAERVAARLERRGTGMIHHRASRLGPRNAIALVRRLVRDGDPRAVIDGRNYYLTPTAEEEELRRRGVRASTSEASADLGAEIGIRL